MASRRKRAGAALLIIGSLLLAIVVIWDLTRPDSFLWSSFGAGRNPESTARSLVEGLRVR